MVEASWDIVLFVWCSGNHANLKKAKAFLSRKTRGTVPIVTLCVKQYPLISALENGDNLLTARISMGFIWFSSNQTKPNGSVWVNTFFPERKSIPIKKLHGIYIQFQIYFSEQLSSNLAPTCHVVFGSN